MSDIKILDIQLEKNFRLQEFVCKCGCGKVILDLPGIQALQKVRDALGAPLVIASGYRCEPYNKRIGGVTNSNHLKGKAYDVKCSSKSVYQVAKEAYKAGFTGIGISDNKPNSYYVHLTWGGTSKSYWLYDKNNARKAITFAQFQKLVGLI
jgi:uncharacterized protein YcbK (DUF882 family)